MPGFNPIQEYKDYDVRMHHTNVDLYERVREQDLKQNAVVHGVVRLAGGEHRRAPPQALTRVAATSVGAGILISRLAGLVRVRLIAKYFGQQTEAADAFNAAFRIPNLLQNLFGEGALSGSFIPVHAGAARARRARGGRRRRRGRSSRC